MARRIEAGAVLASSSESWTVPRESSPTKVSGGHRGADRAALIDRWRSRFIVMTTASSAPRVLSWTARWRFEVWVDGFEW
jgi:hypothetical protein